MDNENWSTARRVFVTMIFIALLLIGAMVLDTANTSNNSVIEPHIEATSQVKIDRGDQKK